MTYKIAYFFVLLVLISSCGLNTFYLIEPPYNADERNPANGEIQSIPFLYNSYIFTARDLSSSGFINPGTDVYYRIYANQTDLQNDAKRINDANDEDTNSGFKQLESLNYQKLRSLSGGENSLIDKFGGRVIIQLTNDTSTDAYISVSGLNKGKPIRSNDNYFNFDKDNETSADDKYDIPDSYDDDFESENTIEYYYVNAYAVSTGMDVTTYEAVQSEVLSLGFTAHESN